MSQLRESVIIHTPGGDLHGHLFIGADGLPELLVDCGCPEYYSLRIFPAAWSISSPTCGDLYTAWCDIVAVMERLRGAQWKAEADNPCKQGDGYVSHDFVGDSCIRCGLSDHVARQRETEETTT